MTEQGKLPSITIEALDVDGGSAAEYDSKERYIFIRNEMRQTLDEMNDEQVLDHILSLERFVKENKLKLQESVIVFEERKSKASEGERKRLQKMDKERRESFLSGNEIAAQRKARKPAVSGLTKLQKMQAELEALGLSKEEIKEKLLKEMI